MGLYLVEVDIDVSTPEKRAAVMERIEQVVTNKGTPTAKLVAGPFGSLNRPTIYLALDNPDQLQSLPELMGLYEAGLVRDIRTEPVADWDSIKAAAAKVER